LSAFDAIVVGGGPAGLSAALVLGRCRRRVLLIDDEKPRNARSRAVHGFLGHDDLTPASLREAAVAQLRPYDVEVRRAKVVHAARQGPRFVVTDSTERRAEARKLLLATGVVDEVPALPGAAKLYGRGLYPCAYCDGWEFRDKALAAFGQGAGCIDAALGLTTWSRDVVWFTNRGGLPGPEELARLDRHGVTVCDDAVIAFEGVEDGLRGVRTTRGTVLRDAVFLHLGQRAQSPLAAMLGCELERNGVVETFDEQRTCVPGLYLAGDASHDVKFAIVAAAHGARAAHDINQALREEDTA
jgi:thioredoxin reductase